MSRLDQEFADRRKRRIERLDPTPDADVVQQNRRFERAQWFLRRMRYWLFDASFTAKRNRLGQLFRQIGRTTRLDGPALSLARKIEQAGRRLSRRAKVHAAERAAKASQCPPRGYDVICLPIIPWDSRFQRPQQLMRQFADRGHRVFYASLDFRRGANARLHPLLPHVFEMILPSESRIRVYRRLPSSNDVRRMASAIDRLRRDNRIASAVIVVQFPFWTALAETLREKFGWPIVYDCMDDHSGFSTNVETMLLEEERTIATADLVVATSDVLRAKVQATARRTAIIRSACDFDHFAATPLQRQRNAQVTVGYYGAIAEWFDADLVADLALLRPDWNFELIGSTFTGDVTRLKKLPNVALLGEKRYSELPRLVAGWDCFIIPFKRIPLTEATNPAKAYEMLATGKPVVAVDLPELRPMARDGLMSLADDAPGFADAIVRASAENSDSRRESRRAFAAQNTWRDRYNAFDSAVRRLFPPASIIIAVYNNLGLTQMCLESIFRDTEYPNYEVIVVDNASRDGTAEWLAEEARREPRLRVIYNADNRGFSAANNQGLHVARGEFLCLLNNDTVVTPGWLSTLIGHLRETPRLGLVGPVSNMVGNEAIVPVGYKNLSDMQRWAERYCRRHDGQTVPMTMLGFFCVVMPRAAYDKVGDMDERFGIGCFEDDDYCCRVLEAGYEMCFVRDAFVHHFQGASFKLLGKAAYQEVFEQNRRKYEEKWGPWRPNESKEHVA